MISTLEDIELYTRMDGEGSNIYECKLVTTTRKGTRVRNAAALEFAKDRIWFVKSPFALKDEIKAMKGSRWHGGDTPTPRKVWSIQDCPRNRFQLRYLLGHDPYEWFDRDIVKHDYSRPLMDHQRDLSDGGLSYHYQIWAAEMGCITGDALVHVNRCGKGFSLTLRELCYKQNGGESRGHSWAGAEKTFIRGYVGGRLGLIPVNKVLFKGVQPTLTITLRSGKSIRLTYDHEVCVGIRRTGQFTRADKLSVGDTVMTAAIPADTCVYADEIVSIEESGETDVYDVVCEGQYRNFVADGVVVHNCGKTLSAIEVIEKSGVKQWYWVGPKAALKAIQREFKKWNIDPEIDVQFHTYESLVRVMDDWPLDVPPPMGVIFDESSRLKNESSQRTRAAQKMADLIRYHYGFDGYVILMSGTPSPKTPLDWWSQAEIAWPGFLKEGSPKALEQRLAFMVDQAYESGVFKKRLGWKDNENKCLVCGLLHEEGAHALDGLTDPEDYHQFIKSENEVALMYERLFGLVVVKHKKDCIDLPDKRYRTVICKPSKSTLRVAQAIVGSADSAVTGMTLLRELSDGFQYREREDGMTPCKHCMDGDGVPTGLVAEWFDPSDPDRTFEAVEMLDPELVGRLEKHEVCCPQCGGEKEVKKYVRETREVPCPKEPALVELLEENEEHGRIVVAAGFTGSVDRCSAICLKNNWDVVRCDGRGFTIFRVESDGTVTTLTKLDALDYWADRTNQRVAFVMHPESGGMGLTLTEASMFVYWSNSFKPEYRIQSEDRIHRKGMDINLGATIVDLIHLPTDQRTLDVIRENRKLELMTMGEVKEVLTDDCVGDGYEVSETFVSA